jgi:hypothetical protein
MPDPLCIAMGGLDVLVGLILLSTFSHVFFMILGILMLIKGGVSFLG